jgi:hypothetical protein
LPNIPIATRLEKKKKGTSKIQRPQVRWMVLKLQVL